jgi:hypothetical protein
MKRVLVVVAALLVVAGCGSAEQSGGGGGDSTGAGSDAQAGSRTVGGCSADSAEVTGAKTLATADLDGDGTAEAVKLTAVTGECPSTLFAEMGESFISTTVPAEPPVTSAYAVDPGTHDLVVTKADHPRGGYQLRVYAGTRDELAELEVDGQPLLPFVATDVKEHPWSIDCGDGGLVFTEAVAHEPVGVAAAWDIKQTTYDVNGTTVTAGPTKEVADNVLPQDLGKKYPDLVRHAAFASCRVS